MTIFQTRVSNSRLATKVFLILTALGKTADVSIWYIIMLRVSLGIYKLIVNSLFNVACIMCYSIHINIFRTFARLTSRLTAKWYYIKWGNGFTRSLWLSSNNRGHLTPPRGPEGQCICYKFKCEIHPGSNMQTSTSSARMKVRFKCLQWMWKETFWRGSKFEFLLLYMGLLLTKTVNSIT